MKEKRGNKKKTRSPAQPNSNAPRKTETERCALNGSGWDPPFAFFGEGGEAASRVREDYAAGLRWEPMSFQHDRRGRPPFSRRAWERGGGG